MDGELFVFWGVVRYFEDLFAQDANQPTLVNVASKIYRGVS